MTDTINQQVSMEEGDIESPSSDYHLKFPEVLYVEVGEWRDNASCRNLGNREFFGEIPRGSKGSRAKLIASAMRVCNECPVKAQCLNFALKNQERFGVWGGVDFFNDRGGRKYLEQLTQ